MLSRLFSVLLSLALLALVAGFTGTLVFKYGVIKNSHIIWEIFLVLLPVNAVIIWLNWQAIRRLSRYGGNPFQIARVYQIRLLEQVEAGLGPIVIEGPALLIVRSSVASARIDVRDIQPADWRFHRRFRHGQHEVEFLFDNAGTWSATLTAKAPKVLGTSFQLFLTSPDDGVFARIELEVRGHCRVMQLPQYIDEGSRGFPVVIRDGK